MYSEEELDNLNIQISRNLKEIRKSKNLTLDALSALCGVSKSMLGQIERGESSPTITTLWKIATALHISFTSLLEEASYDVEVIDNYKITPLISDEGKFRLYPTFPFDNSRNFEMFYIEVDPFTKTESSPHEKDTFEYIIVYEGQLEVDINGEIYILNKGNAIKYDASVEHGYANSLEHPAKICMVIYYNNTGL